MTKKKELWPKDIGAIKIKIFNYIPELDAFVSRKEYKEIADRLGLTEWTYVVWIGRLFTLDNDYGEHWFDNWDEREAIDDKAHELGYDSESLYILKPSWFKNDRDGPCNTDELRKQFWTDVLQSLTLSLGLMFSKALDNQLPIGDPDRIPVRKRIKEIVERYQTSESKGG